MGRSRRMTEAQQRTLDAVVEFTATYGYPPTVREVAAATGKSSPATVWKHLRVLAERGMIRHDPTVPRGIVVTAHGHHQHHPARDPSPVWVPYLNTPPGEQTVAAFPVPSTWTQTSDVWCEHATVDVDPFGIRVGDLLVCEPFNGTTHIRYPLVMVTDSDDGDGRQLITVHEPCAVPPVSQTCGVVRVILRTTRDGDGDRTSPSEGSDRDATNGTVGTDTRNGEP